MALTPGSRLGPYEIVASLGGGGMGEVYRARDSRLNRDVAVKVLHASLAASPEARARFAREARSISQLNHPHICTVYDIGSEPPLQPGAAAEAGAEPVSFLVMELLEGESLARCLKRGPLPPAEALDYAIQIADALDKAHRHGVVHRDLKPANVMLAKGGAARATGTTTRSGATTAKLLDFGLAKLAPTAVAGSLETVLAARSAGAMTSTPAQPVTAEGVILGTFQYMAPEQVEAGAVDARADIWAFGCVLYEMLTGRRAFEGRTQASVIASILEREPTPVSELQPLAPPALARVVRICLAKDPDARFQSAYDLLLQLQWIAEGGSAAGLPAPVVARRRRRERLMWIGVTGVALVAAAAAAWWAKPAPAPANVIGRFSYELPEGQTFTHTTRRYLAISPDGRRMAYTADKQIYVRELDQLESKPLPGTLEDPLDLAFSPDGQWLAYFAHTSTGGSTLKKIHVGGGTPVTLCQADTPYGVHWRGNTIVFGQNGETVRGILSVPDTAGAPTTLVSVGPDQLAAMPQLIDDDGTLLFTLKARSASWDTASVVVQAPGATVPTVVVEGGADGRVVAGDRLLYLHGNTLFGIGFDRGRRATRGGAVPLVVGVRTASDGGAGLFAAAEAGPLIYLAGATATHQHRLVWVDRAGREEAIPAPAGEYRHPRVSPDGTRIAVAVHAGELTGLAVWDIGRQAMTRVTPPDEREALAPLWTPDSRHLIYRSLGQDGAGRIMRVAASGASAAEVLWELGPVAAPNGFPESISADGKWLFFRQTSPSPQVMVADLEVRGPPTALALGAVLMSHGGAISPDSRSLAYAAYDAGRELPPKLFVRPYPEVEHDRRQASPDGGYDPQWSRSGGELFYLAAPNKLMSVTVQPGLVLGPATEVLDASPYAPYTRSGSDYDAAPDGRFLMIRMEAADARARTARAITIVTHWIDELKARVQ